MFEIKKKRKKRGISPIVAETLLILMTIAILFIVGAALRKNLMERLSSGSGCDVADLTISNEFTCYDSTNGIVGVEVAKGGSTEVNLTGVIFVFESDTGSKKNLKAQTIDLNYKRTFYFSGFGNDFVPNKVGIVPVIKLKNGKDSKCKISSRIDLSECTGYLNFSCTGSECDSGWVCSSNSDCPDPDYEICVNGTCEFNETSCSQNCTNQGFECGNHNFCGFYENCAPGCTGNQFCNASGRCVVGPFCTKSDGSNSTFWNILVKGSISNQTGNNVAYDSCFNSTAVNELYCNATTNRTMNKTIGCGSGQNCSNGACTSTYSLCYQETANASHISDPLNCGLNYSGNYSYPNGNFLYINYVKPSAAVGAFWNASFGLENKSMRIPDECWNAHSNFLSLRVETISNNGLGYAITNMTCEDTTGRWVQLGFSSDEFSSYSPFRCSNPFSMFDGNWGSFGGRMEVGYSGSCWGSDVLPDMGARGWRLYEEAMIWNVSNVVAICKPHQSLADGKCVCDSGWSDCDGNIANGCEVNLLVNLTNCGSCGAVCSGGAMCIGGSCVPAPVMNFGFDGTNWLQDSITGKSLTNHAQVTPSGVIQLAGCGSNKFANFTSLGQQDDGDYLNGSVTNFTDHMTISLWASYDSVSSGYLFASCSCGLDCGGCMVDGKVRGIRLASSSGINRVDGITGYSTNWQDYAVQSTGNIFNNKWYNAVLVVNNTILSIYINGTLSASNTVPAIYNFSTSFYLGRSSHSSGHPWFSFGGKIDELKMWNYTLSQAQVQAIYNSEASKFAC